MNIAKELKDLWEAITLVDEPTGEEQVGVLSDVDTAYGVIELAMAEAEDLLHNTNAYEEIYDRKHDIYTLMAAKEIIGDYCDPRTWGK